VASSPGSLNGERSVDDNNAIDYIVSLYELCIDATYTVNREAKSVYGLRDDSLICGPINWCRGVT
jgi:hypothetical protein